jgi:ADP-heptose:LPS heptosyltransferase
MKDTPQTILVIKHGALGDILQALDGFASLRAGYPDAHIAVLTAPAFAGLMASMPWFDDVLLDKRASLFNLLQTVHISRILRRGWDLIVDMQGTQRTGAYFSTFVPAKTRWVGIARGCSDPLPDFGLISNSVRMRLIAEQAGGFAAEADLAWLTNNGKSAVDRLVGAARAPYAILVPGCSPTHPEKRWPADHYVQLAVALVKQGVAVLVVGTDADQTVVDYICANCPDAINLCGKTTLSDLAVLMQRASSVTGNDTGPMFLAAKTGTPTVVLMGATAVPEKIAPVGKRVGWLKCDPIDKIAVDAVLSEIDRLCLKG